METAAAYARKLPTSLFIGGSWVEALSGATLDVVDPTTERRIATIAAGDGKDIDRAVRAARAAFEDASWRDIGPHQRTNYLLAIADLVAAHAEELSAISTLEMGMLYGSSLFTTRSMVDVFRYYAGWPTKMFGKTNPSDAGSFSYTRREPLGVVGAIIPWNGPILYTSWKIATALATGNTVVLKPAEQAPLTCLRFAELVKEAGLPDGVVNVVTGLGGVAGTALVEHPDVAKITLPDQLLLAVKLCRVRRGRSSMLVWNSGPNRRSSSSQMRISTARSRLSCLDSPGTRARRAPHQLASSTTPSTTSFPRVSSRPCKHLSWATRGTKLLSWGR